MSVVASSWAPARVAVGGRNVGFPAGFVRLKQRRVTVMARELHQFPMRAGLDNPPVVENQYQIRTSQRTQPMGGDKGRPA
jgi:hypothetical protein